MNTAHVDWVMVDPAAEPNVGAVCRRCGKKLRVEVPVDGRGLVKILGGFIEAHARCVEKPKRRRGPNLKGCRPTGDVCMEHDSPLVCRHGCDEAKPHGCVGETP